MRRHLTLGLLAGAVLGAGLLVPAVGQASATGAVMGAVPESATLTAEVQVRDAHHARDVSVLAEPGRGRIEVGVLYSAWPAGKAGRYLHVVLGTADGDRCAADLRVVMDTRHTGATRVYEGAGAPLTETEQFTVPVDWRQQVARVGVAAFDEVDCARMTSYASGDPVHHGPRIWTSPSYDLQPRTTGNFGTFPLSVSCPRALAWGEPLELGVKLSTAPGPFPDGYRYAVPSVLGAADVTVVAGDYDIVSVPDVPDDVDLWTSPDWTGTVVLDPDDAQVYRLSVSGTTDLEGDAVAWHCRPRVLMPPPTDWSGTLAGTTWWDWAYDSDDELGSYLHHFTYEFLDGDWVFVSRAYKGARTTPCTEVDDRWPWGCHRYYYDEATDQLQIDDRRARRGDGWWSMPGGPRYARFWFNQIVLPIHGGERFSYHGESRDGELRLREDGRYRYEGPHPRTGRHVTWSGRYRFVGGDAQQLVLRHGRRTFRDEAQLYYWRGDDGPELRDLDTRTRRMRFQLG